MHMHKKKESKTNPIEDSICYTTEQVEEDEKVFFSMIYDGLHINFTYLDKTQTGKWNVSGYVEDKMQNDSYFFVREWIGGDELIGMCSDHGGAIAKGKEACSHMLLLKNAYSAREDEIYSRWLTRPHSKPKSLARA